ncbi:MAG: hypothetical protein K2X82_29460 [Gemmataceae bacterium]|nr:hypothetical protein [Gemmataceae bacterium]
MGPLFAGLEKGEGIASPYFFAAIIGFWLCLICGPILLLAFCYLIARRISRRKATGAEPSIGTKE